MTAQQLAELIQRATPMTEAALFEQRVSFVFGQLGGSATKEEIREVLRRQGYWHPTDGVEVLQHQPLPPKDADASTHPDKLVSGNQGNDEGGRG